MKLLLTVLSLISLMGCNGGDLSSLQSSNSKVAVNSVADDSPNSDPASASTADQGSSSTMKHFVYVANRGSNTISQFEIDETDGHLIPIPGHETIMTGGQPKAIKIHPTQPYLFVACSQESKIWMYAIDTDTGALTLHNNTSIGTELLSSNLGFTADGIYFSVASNYTSGQQYWKFSILNGNPVPQYLSKGITPVTGADMSNPTQLTQGDYKYKLVAGSDSIQQLNASNSILSTDTTGDNPVSIAIK